MASYLELEKLKKSWNGEVGIFGAGELGGHIAYDLIQSAGFSIDFYFDNNIPDGTIIRDGIAVRGNHYLYNNQESILLFVCIAPKYQEEVLSGLYGHDVGHMITVDWRYIAAVLDSVELADNSVKEKYASIYDDKIFLSKFFRRKTGYELNFEEPKTFNEKLQWLKVFNRKAEYTLFVDKYAVKKYVSEKIGKEYVVPLLGVWDSFDDINFDSLPKQFVLKCTHDSGSTVIVENKDLLDYTMTKDKLDSALGINYYWLGREFPYKNVPRKIIAEKYMAPPQEMVDYKLLCFNGVPKILFVCTERFEPDGLKVTFFDLDWNKLDFERHYPASSKVIARPKNLDLMIELAATLSAGIPFVRTDFYEINDRIYFGELTFFPGGGMEEFTPVEWDYKLGEMIELDGIE